MDSAEYEARALETWTRDPIACAPLAYLTIGLTNEAGEVAGFVKKLYRDDPDLDCSDELADELGDVLWYLTVLAHEAGLGLEDVMRANNEKTARRQANGTIHGSGDR